MLSEFTKAVEEELTGTPYELLDANIEEDSRKYLSVFDIKLNGIHDVIYSHFVVDSTEIRLHKSVEQLIKHIARQLVSNCIATEIEAIQK